MHAFIVLTTENYKKKNRIEIESLSPALPRKRKNRIRNNEIFSLQPHTRREEKGDVDLTRFLSWKTNGRQE